MFNIMKFDTATWTPVVGMWKMFINTISLSPNEHILACASGAPLDKKVPLLNLETNQPIGTLVHNEDAVNSATFSADGKFLITSCSDGHIYTWDLSAIVKNATPRPVSKINGAHRIPTGFFDDALRDTNSQGVHNPPAPAPSKRTRSRFSTFWRRSKPHGATEPDTQSRSRPLSWTRNLVSGILHRREGSGIQLGEVNVPYTAGKPRNYHARKKKAAASSSRPPNTHTTQQFGEAAQSIPSSSQLPPLTTTASTFSAIPGTTRATGTISRPHIAGAGRRARFVGWVCCMPIQNVDGYH
ncbi:hypothetical protein BD769DRAFT_1112817 [Suillus cothurnatus]|nr:hypothetical protein BD769DRAFT_1112817 [Suillus cothurnatus]